VNTTIVVADTHHGEDVRWSNEIGWIAERSGATVFTASEIRSLPMGASVRLLPAPRDGTQ
jgi:hypothetical protein